MEKVVFKAEHAFLLFFANVVSVQGGFNDARNFIPH